jgi:hypothetical protein
MVACSFRVGRPLVGLPPGFYSQTSDRVATGAHPKGELLEDIFGETDHIRRSDQGKSFDDF